MKIEAGPSQSPVFVTRNSSKVKTVERHTEPAAVDPVVSTDKPSAEAKDAFIKSMMIMFGWRDFNDLDGLRRRIEDYIEGIETVKKEAAEGVKRIVALRKHESDLAAKIEVVREQAKKCEELEAGKTLEDPDVVIRQIQEALSKVQQH